jgi:hypothetical protein
MQFKVIRTYPNYYTATIDYLQEAFNEGWQYKCCHEIKQKNDETILEYILYKKIKVVK